MSNNPFEPGKEPIPSPGEIPEVVPPGKPLKNPGPGPEPEIIPWEPHEDPERVNPPDENPVPETQPERP